MGCTLLRIRSNPARQKERPAMDSSRARRGKIPGQSTSHASNIRLVKNLPNGRVSTQYHVVYNDYFTIVSTKENIYHWRPHRHIYLNSCQKHLLMIKCAKNSRESRCHRIRVPVGRHKMQIIPNEDRRRYCKTRWSDTNGRK